MHHSESHREPLDAVAHPVSGQQLAELQQVLQQQEVQPTRMARQDGAAEQHPGEQRREQPAGQSPFRRRARRPLVSAQQRESQIPEKALT